MSMAPQPRGLIFLVADKSMKVAMDAVLRRPRALGIRPLSPSEYDVITQINYDASVFATGHEFLRSQQHRYRYALMMCDRIGCGHEEKAREELEREMEVRLFQSGWASRSAAVVVDPELEVWVWSDSPHVDSALGWRGRRPAMRVWMAEKGYLTEGQLKPARPRECLDEALRIAGKPKSSSLFQAIAERVSLRNCKDPAYLKLASTLRSWFGPPHDLVS